MTRTANFSFLTGMNAEYIADLYAKYRQDPSAVAPSWKQLFDDMADDEAALLKDLFGASWTPPQNRKAGYRKDYQFSEPANDTGGKGKKGAGQAAAANPEAARAAALDSLRAVLLIKAYRTHGHYKAHLDPLGLHPPRGHAELDAGFYGFTGADMDRPIQLGGILGFDQATLTQIIATCESIYCGTVGVEFSGIQSADERQWLEKRWESLASQDPAAQDRKTALSELTTAEMFEMFLHTKFQGAKRFGCDGTESLIPAIEAVIRRAAQQGVEEALLGMAHRGRLNVLTNIAGKSYTALFGEFQGKYSVPDGTPGSSDVKYHMGASSDRDYNGKSVHVSLSFNPSHLEFVNAVTMGKARARLHLRDEIGQRTVLPILIHGDAAFAGQGIVAECLMMAELRGYNVGGTMHIIANNQIGFTTLPHEARSGPYSSDLAKMLMIPIFHVNAEDTDSVIKVAQMAADYRQEFGRDVVIDLIGYRRYGHNEGDEPLFTQPVMYAAIKGRKSLRTLYAEKLIAAGAVSADEADGFVADTQKKLDAGFAATETYKANKADWLEGSWSKIKIAAADVEGKQWTGQTAVPEKRLLQVGADLTTVPKDFAINPKIARQLETKQDMFATKSGFDWGTAEALAFGTLLQDGYAIRLSGEDCERGTFSHRHAVMYDQNTNGRCIPLDGVTGKKGRFEVYNSPLSEEAVMGYEHGYTLSDPNSLVLWEGQFGDFANGAQVIIDQFIASSETKWLRMSGLVLLLPHGFEGQGPEHSSARLERFLQLCAENNMQVTNITTPANYFHALRRQMVRDIRKPMINMSPKSLLRHKMAVSSLADFTGDTTFQTVIPDTTSTLGKADKVRRVVFCSGKVYYDLLDARDQQGITDVALVRVEQLYPFPANAIASVMKTYKNADVIWCQEEPKNQGAWFFVNSLLEDVLVGMKHTVTRPAYAGRAAAAAPACGSLKKHQYEQAALVAQALGK
ncbi:MAG: 2-oxoglutarate dehydrogenase E1 component [Pseudomonadota bacterium]